MMDRLILWRLHASDLCIDNVWQISKRQRRTMLAPRNPLPDQNQARSWKQQIQERKVHARNRRKNMHLLKVQKAIFTENLSTCQMLNSMREISPTGRAILMHTKTLAMYLGLLLLHQAKHPIPLCRSHLVFFLNVMLLWQSQPIHPPQIYQTRIQPTQSALNLLQQSN